MPKSLFIGCTVVDMISFVASYPPADVKIPALMADIYGGGPAFNASITHSFLGGESTLAASLGAQSVYKTLILEELNEYHINIFDICNDSKYKIPVSTIISAQDTGSRLIINSPQPPCESVYQMPHIFDESYDIILLDQHEKKFVELHADKIEHFSGTVVLDGGGWKAWSKDYLQLADIPIVSEYFYQGKVEDFKQECTRLGIQKWAMTLGAKGIVYFENNTLNTITVPTVKAIDTSGAGDIFHGAFCYYYGESKHFSESLAKAAKIASYSCTQLGTRSWMKTIKS